jgi:non-ribosomal peptide synthase protein (TIGR01720 family)
MDVELVDAGAAVGRRRARIAAAPAVRSNAPLDAMIGADLVPALRRHLAERLPDFMIPAAFVVVDAIPLTTNGKVDRAALPLPDDERPDVAEEFVAPRTPSEAVLAELWGNVIGIDRVGVHDNFFELGGDSILCLQIISRARAAGLAVTVTQLFEHQTIAGLAEVAERSAGDVRLAADQGVQSGPATLTPVQRWLLDDPPAGVDHFNQSVLLEVPAALDARVLERALAAVSGHHDALRLRFDRTQGGWVATYADPSTTVPVTVHHLAALTDDELGPEVERRAAQAEAGLDITRGPLVRAELYHAGRHRPARLLLAVHHLVVDGVSWRFLLEDLWSAYSQLGNGQPARLPVKTTAIGRWSEAVRAYADDPTIADTAAGWAALVEPAEVALPVDASPGRPTSGANVVGAAETVTVAVPATATARLLTHVPSAVGARIEDVLLAALARVLSAWCGRSTVCIDVEGHGREPIAPEIDVSRTVGWFTSIAPARLCVPERADLAHSVPSIAAQYRARPGPSLAFGALRHLSSAAATRRLLGGLARRQLCFNYLGQFSRASDDRATPIRGAREEPGPMRDRRGERRYLVEIDATVAVGELSFTWAYCRHVHRRETIAALAERVVTDLVRLVDQAGGGPAESVSFPASPLPADEVATVLAQLTDNADWSGR